MGRKRKVVRNTASPAEDVIGREKDFAAEYQCRKR